MSQQVDYANSWVANAIRAIWIKMNQILNTSAVINPSGFTKNLLGLNITNPQQLANAIDQLVLTAGGGFAPVSIVVATSGTTITFPTPFGVGVTWDLIYSCTDSTGNMVAVQITNRTQAGFEVFPAINAKFTYQIFVV
jgi:hypothetical protein